jgi:hypothetical protein
MTVYVPPEVKEEAERRAADLSIAPGALLRMILLGKQPPLVVDPAGRA